MRLSHVERIDYEYVHNGGCNILKATEPLRGKRVADVSETKIVFTPKYGSWLNIAEIELYILSGRALVGSLRLKQCAMKLPHGRKLEIANLEL